MNGWRGGGDSGKGNGANPMGAGNATRSQAARAATARWSTMGDVDDGPRTYTFARFASHSKGPVSGSHQQRHLGNSPPPPVGPHTAHPPTKMPPHTLRTATERAVAQPRSGRLAALLPWQGRPKEGGRPGSADSAPSDSHRHLSVTQCRVSGSLWHQLLAIKFAAKQAAASARYARASTRLVIAGDLNAFSRHA
jgi:hypothetical protein